MAWLYLDEHLDDAAIKVGATVTINGADARHAALVARVKTGERIAVGTGRGVLGIGPVLVSDPKALSIQVEEVVREDPPRPSLWLAQALAKGGRDELAVQAATEIGASGFIPWQAERSIVRWEGAKAEKGLERWRSIVREASKQAVRARVPDVADLASTDRLRRVIGTLLLLDPDADLPLTKVSDEVLASQRLVLLVGPEGGVSPAERDLLVQAGALPVRLGDTVLRTSTAGPAALAVLQALLGRW